LTGASLLVFRARARRAGTEADEGDLVRVPWHPFTTVVFVAACWAVSLTTVVQYPRNAGIGVVILALGVVAFQFWKGGSAAPA
jgi:APA family basic amino acid/polyamine antiporter